jgi:hypothetical protein
MTAKTIDRRRFLRFSLSPIALSAVGIAEAVAATRTVRSGVETCVARYFDIEPGTRFAITQRPAHGTARVAVINRSSNRGNPTQVAEIFYKSKPGYVGTDSFSYQRTSRSGSNNYTLSVNVVP